MSKPKHTPGPWQACCPTTEAHYVFGNNDEIVICRPLHNDPEEDDFESFNGIVTKRERLANAQLIAAAPDMLEALENIENDDHHMPSSAWDLIQQAIAKAKGGGQ